MKIEIEGDPSWNQAIPSRFLGSGISMMVLKNLRPMMTVAPGKDGSGFFQSENDFDGNALHCVQYLRYPASSLSTYQETKLE